MWLVRYLAGMRLGLSLFSGDEYDRRYFDRWSSLYRWVFFFPGDTIHEEHYALFFCLSIPNNALHLKEEQVLPPLLTGLCCVWLSLVIAIRGMKQGSLHLADPMATSCLAACFWALSWGLPNLQAESPVSAAPAPMVILSTFSPIGNSDVHVTLQSDPSVLWFLGIFFII